MLASWKRYAYDSSTSGTVCLPFGCELARILLTQLPARDCAAAALSYGITCSTHGQTLIMLNPFATSTLRLLSSLAFW